MKASEIYRALSQELHWAAKTDRVRWLASRYYAGVDTLIQLRDSAKPRPVSRDFILCPELSEEAVQEIIRLR
jgi:hypothetical protein